MNTQNDGWIKISEREPETPYWYFGPELAGAKLIQSLLSVPYPHDSRGYWKPATVPAPPVKEKTQREMDEEGYSSWRQDNDPNRCTYLQLWHAALAYRDKQNAGDVKELFIAPSMTHATSDAIKNLRRRCGLEQ